MQSWIGNNKWNHLTAPSDYHQARLRYADAVLKRAQEQYRPQDIKILTMVYAPIMEKVKRSMERKYGYQRRSDIEDVVYAEFMHMLQMYDSTRVRHLKFPNFLKNYFEGWCHRNLSQIMATTRRGPLFLNSNSFDESQNDHIAALSGASQSDSEGPELEASNRDVIRIGIKVVRKKFGEKVVDALLLAYLYNYTHIEISELLGCTQARVSQMLKDAKECFIEKITSEDD